MILLTAKFTGKDSLGFKNGTRYRLSLNQHGIQISIVTKEGEFPDYKELRCDYGNIDLFLKNWEVQKLHETEKISGSSGVGGSVGSVGLTGYSGSVGSVGLPGYSGCSIGVGGSVGSVGLTGYSGNSGTIGSSGVSQTIGISTSELISKLRSSMRNTKLNNLLS